MRFKQWLEDLDDMTGEYPPEYGAGEYPPAYFTTLTPYLRASQKDNTKKKKKSSKKKKKTSD